HFHEVARAAGTAVQPAAIGGRSENSREGLDFARRGRRAAEHQTVSVFQSPYAARYATIDETHAVTGEVDRAPHRILVKGVAAVAMPRRSGSSTLSSAKLAREVARNAAPTMSAAPISVRHPGVSPSNANASAIP